MNTNTYTGTITATEWDDLSYWMTLATDTETLRVRGSDRLAAVLPVEGDRIRIALRVTPRGHYNPQSLHDEPVYEGGFLVTFERI